MTDGPGAPDAALVTLTGAVWSVQHGQANWVPNGWNGTPGDQLWDFALQIVDAAAGLSIQYYVTASGYGTLPWVMNGARCGHAPANPILRFGIKLTGQGATEYDVNYRAVDVAGTTTDWYSNGQACSALGNPVVLSQMEANVAQRAGGDET